MCGPARQEGRPLAGNSPHDFMAAAPLCAHRPTARTTVPECLIGHQQAAPLHLHAPVRMAALRMAALCMAAPVRMAALCKTRRIRPPSFLICTTTPCLRKQTNDTVPASPSDPVGGSFMTNLRKTALLRSTSMLSMQKSLQVRGALQVLRARGTSSGKPAYLPVCLLCWCAPLC